ncbi:MAG: 2-oxo-4-hydroxy-4-carboxy-5-ureidoimidazoline decarboxylase, partial [Granulosicoccus sp.]|nr:2-oxo-4-hydroxy-4-carboxy-5-ureidoimidazoline decarboxylase [Granulosicoccus sp.]
MSLTELSKETFVQYFGGLYEGAPWVAERVYDSGLTASNDDAESLAEAFETVVENSSLAEKLQLIRNHPDLVGRNALKRKLSDASKLEQASASLDQCTPQQFERFHELNKLYWARFGFPFVVAVRDSEPAEILAEFTRRIARSKDEEFDEALLEAKKIARWRLRALLNGDTGESIGGVTQVQANDVNSIASTHFPGALAGLFLGVQHVLAMFVSNVTPAIIIAGAVGFGFGSADTSDMIYLIQMSMFFAGIATLIQTITLGPIGARLPIMQGTSFAFIP